MKKLAFILLLFSPPAAADFGSNTLWYYSFALDENTFSLSPDRVCHDGIKAIFMHTNPYRIESLSWNYTAASLGRGRWGIMGALHYYALDNLYSSYSITLGSALRISDNTHLSLAIAPGREEFDSKSFNNLKMCFRVAYSAGNGVIGAGVTEIQLYKSYSSTPDNPSPFFSLNIPVSVYVHAGVGYFWVDNIRGRAAVINNIRLTEKFTISLGYLSNPDVVHCGLDFAMKKIKFGIIYQGIDKLNDTVIWSISTGK